MNFLQKTCAGKKLPRVSPQEVKRNRIAHGREKIFSENRPRKLSSSPLTFVELLHGSLRILLSEEGQKSLLFSQRALDCFLIFLDRGARDLFISVLEIEKFH
jgi:hypothetical protein